MEIDKPIATAVMLFVTLVLITYLVVPKYQTFQELLIELGKKEVEFQSKNAYFIEITKTYKELMQYQDSLKKVETALPDKPSLGSLVSFLYQKGSENGIIIQKINVFQGAPVDLKTDIKKANISLNLFGSYEAFKNFLASIENSARLIETEDFAFGISPPTLTNPVIQETFPVKLDIKVYSY